MALESEKPRFPRAFRGLSSQRCPKATRSCRSPAACGPCSSTSRFSGKNETLYDCRIDPWRPLSDVTDGELERVVRRAREMMLREVRHGGRLSGGEVFEQRGRGCRRCGTRIRVKGQWDENRMTYWCPNCQS